MASPCSKSRLRNRRRPEVAQAFRPANGRRGSPEGLRYVNFATCSQKPPRSSQKFLCACVALSAVFAFGAGVARAQQTDRARTEALARRAADRLQSLQREADRLATQERTLIGDLRKLELERELKTEELKQ